jgi:hypothetical protein
MSLLTSLNKKDTSLPMAKDGKLEKLAITLTIKE